MYKIWLQSGDPMYHPLPGFYIESYLKNYRFPIMKTTCHDQLVGWIEITYKLRVFIYFWEDKFLLNSFFDFFNFGNCNDIQWLYEHLSC